MLAFYVAVFIIYFPEFVTCFLLPKCILCRYLEGASSSAEDVLLGRAGGALRAAAEDTFWTQETGDELEETNDNDRNVESKQEEEPSSSRGRKKKTTLFDLNALSDGIRNGLSMGVIYIVGELTSPKEDEVCMTANEPPSAIAAAVAEGVKVKEGRLFLPFAG